MSICTNGSSGGVLAGKETSEEDDEFLIVKGVKVPRVRGGKRWEEHSKNSQKKIIPLYYKKAFRKHQKHLEKQAVCVFLYRKNLTNHGHSQLQIKCQIMICTN